MLRIRLITALVFGWSSPAQAQEVTRVTVLTDAFSDRADLKMDWGYSALIEHREKRILFDTGNNFELFQPKCSKAGHRPSEPRLRRMGNMLSRLGRRFGEAIT